MSTTPDTSAFVNAIACDLEEGGFRQVSGTTLRRTLTTAVSAALPLLADTGIPTSQTAELAEPQGERTLAEARRVVSGYEQRLAATGKQQVGEVQGDARELLAAECDKNEVTAAAARRLRGHNETEVEAAALRVIAARQPGAQVPVAYMVRWRSAGGWGLRMPNDMKWFRDRADEYEIRDLVFPPAQGIDPSGGMAQEYQRWIDFYHAGEGSYDDFLSKHVLIDGQRDAAPGVGNG